MKKKKKAETAETHPDLKGLDIRVNEFGEIISNIPVEKLNDFLNKNVLDKKLDRNVSVRSLTEGLYELTADGPPEAAASRLEAIAGGYRKLAEVEFVTGEPHRFHFACGQAHDALVGLLLQRAINVRAILREQEMAASRGLLVAPSAQK